MTASNTTLRRQLPSSNRRHMALRIPEADLAIIDQLANHHRLTHTEYMIRASTGELADPTDHQAEHEAIHQHLELLERFAFGVA